MQHYGQKQAHVTKPLKTSLWKLVAYTPQKGEKYFFVDINWAINIRNNNQMGHDCEQVWSNKSLRKHFRLLYHRPSVAVHNCMEDVPCVRSQPKFLFVYHGCSISTSRIAYNGCPISTSRIAYMHDIACAVRTMWHTSPSRMTISTRYLE